MSERFRFLRGLRRSGARIAADAVQKEVHGAEARGGIHDLNVAECVQFQEMLFVGVHFGGVVLTDVLVGGEQEAPVPAAGSMIGSMMVMPGLGCMTSTMARISKAR